MKWRSTFLSEVAESIDYGLTASATQEPTGPKFLRITDIQDDRVNWGTVPFCPANQKAEQSNKLRAGDIVFARTGATTGKSFLIKSCPDRAVFASYLIRVRPGSELRPDYLAHYFQSEGYWGQIRNMARGAAQPGINSTVLKSLSIPLPPLDEQRRIAAILDQADALRRKRRETLSQLGYLTQSLFDDLFGDPLSNPKQWLKAKVSTLFERITVGIVVKPASYYKERGVFAIRGTNIKEEGIDTTDAVYFSEEDNEKILSKTRVWAEDLVIVRSGRPGLTAVVPAELHGSNSIDVLIATPKLNRIVPVFFRDLMNSDHGKQLVLSEQKGQIQKHFNVGSLSDAQIIVPPIEVQNEYAQKLASVAAYRTTQDQSVVQLDALFASLQHRAFRGEL